MEHVTLGDVLFIILILGVIHGIMHAVNLSRKRRNTSRVDETDR